MCLGIKEEIKGQSLLRCTKHSCVRRELEHLLDSSSFTDSGVHPEQSEVEVAADVGKNSNNLVYDEIVSLSSSNLLPLTSSLFLVKSSHTNALLLSHPKIRLSNPHCPIECALTILTKNVCLFWDIFGSWLKTAELFLLLPITNWIRAGFTCPSELLLPTFFLWVTSLITTSHTTEKHI